MLKSQKNLISIKNKENLHIIFYFLLITIEQKEFYITVQLNLVGFSIYKFFICNANYTLHLLQHHQNKKLLKMENLINLQQERWIDITNFENYEISTYGKKILKQSLNTNGYYHVALRKNDKQQFQLVHRLLAQHFIPNPLLAKCVDHANSDKKDNSISNLRWATNQQNSMNRKKKKNSTSNFKGVSYYQNLGKWLVQIQNNGQKIHLGYFNNEEEAARQYDVKVIELFQEFAKLNFPLENYQQQNNQQ